jgi:hypothetical protein
VRDLPAGGSAEPWRAFRRHAAAPLRDVEGRYGPDGVAYFLGWVKRLGVIAAGDDGRRSGARAGGRRPPRRR